SRCTSILAEGASYMKRRTTSPLSLLIAALAAAPAAANAQSTVTGRVVEGATQRPIAAVTVLIDGTGLGALTSGDGRFVIDNVPAGQTIVRVQSIGYATQEQTVQLADGSSVTVNFALESEALALDEIIVTGTPGGTQRRAI